MKRLITVAAAVVGLAAIGVVQAAQPESYGLDMQNGYALLAFVGNTPAEYAKAQKLASRWESQRRLGLGPQTIVARAIDNTEGMAEQQVRQSGVSDKAVAYVHVH